MKSNQPKSDADKKRDFRSLMRARFRAEDEQRENSCTVGCEDRDTDQTICNGGNSSEFLRF